MSKPPPAAKPTTSRTVLFLKNSSLAEIAVPGITVRLTRSEQRTARFLLKAISLPETEPFAVIDPPLLMRGLLFGLLVETGFSVNRTLVSCVVAKRFCQGLIAGKLCQVWRCKLDQQAPEEAKLGSEFVVNLKTDLYAGSRVRLSILDDLYSWVG
jgi:hypothetical protein